MSKSALRTSSRWPSTPPKMAMQWSVLIFHLRVRKKNSASHLNAWWEPRIVTSSGRHLKRVLACFHAKSGGKLKKYFKAFFLHRNANYLSGALKKYLWPVLALTASSRGLSKPRAAGSDPWDETWARWCTARGRRSVWCSSWWPGWRPEWFREIRQLREVAFQSLNRTTCRKKLTKAPSDVNTKLDGITYPGWKMGRFLPA